MLHPGTCGHTIVFSCTNTVLFTFSVSHFKISYVPLRPARHFECIHLGLVWFIDYIVPKLSHTFFHNFSIEFSRSINHNHTRQRHRMSHFKKYLKIQLKKENLVTQTISLCFQESDKGKGIKNTRLKSKTMIIHKLRSKSQEQKQCK